MQYQKIVSIVYLFLTLKGTSQCPPTQANLSYSPTKTVYCRGDNLTVTFNTANQIINLNWSFTGSAHCFTSAINVYQMNNLQTTGFIMLNGTIKGPFGNCPFNLQKQIIVAPKPIANAGPDVFITPGQTFGVIGGNPTATSGVAPYTYLWTPPGYFVSPSTSAAPNPRVFPPGTPTVYQVLVTDANGCTSTDNVNVYNVTTVQSNVNYAILKKEMDAGYYNSVNNGSSNLLYFKFDEEYYTPASTNLTFKVYDDSGTLLTTLGTLTEVIGDNRYSLNVAGLSAGYYRLHVFNQKNEEWMSRFKVN